MKKTLLYIVLTVVFIVGLCIWYYYYPRKVSFELTEEIKKPNPNFDRTSYTISRYRSIARRIYGFSRRSLSSAVFTQFGCPVGRNIFDLDECILQACFYRSKEDFCFRLRRCCRDVDHKLYVLWQKLRKYVADAAVRRYFYQYCR